MPNARPTQGDPAQEIAALKKRIRQLERSEAEHKRIVEELRLSRQKLRLLIDSGPDFFFMKDLNLRYQLVNAANARFFGRDESDILGKTDAELMPPEGAAACRESDSVAIREKRMVVTTERVGDMVYETRKFPVIVGKVVVGVAGIVRDITARRIAEQALRESEERYKAVFENTGTGTIIIEKDTTISLCNAEYERITGYTREYIQGKSWTITIVPEDLEKMVAQHNLRREHPEQALSGYEFRLIRANGEIRRMYVAVRMIEGTDKSVASVTDITERYNAEESLRSKTALLEALTDTTIDGLLVVDENRKRIATNRRFIELWGIPRHLVDDENDTPLLNHASSMVKHPEQFVERVNYLYDHPHETGREEIELKNGMVFDRYSAPVLGEDGHHYGRIWSFRDITLRKQAENGLRRSEERFRSLVETTSDWVWEVDKNIVYTYASARVKDILGYEPEEIVGKTPFDLMPPNEAGRVGPLFLEIAEGRKPSPPFRTQMSTGTGAGC